MEIVGKAADHRLREQLRLARRSSSPHECRCQQVYDQSVSAPRTSGVELHDCFSANELLLYEALGLCAEGEAPKLVDSGDTTYGRRWVVNPSGRLISGHPLGATGLARCAELTWQLRERRRQAAVRQRHRCASAQHRPGQRRRVVTAYQRAERWDFPCRVHVRVPVFR